ncbi:lipoprotein LpqQ [Mycobacteroides abscessus subsp. abscessus]|uniref:sensor domain-containing protein n=1 Tax=Mycobacteroides abscessus TaxID=36809 RepID=UPI00092C45B6|nr:sensor domain-containing protein [Mycobacteroides abscessus]SHU73112.1 lipoprotein LpqQ [Mycobacteroides abscessus subsp. abscessus]
MRAVVFVHMESRCRSSFKALLAVRRGLIFVVAMSAVVSLIGGCTSSPPVAPAPSMPSSADFVLSLAEAQKLVRIPIPEGEAVDVGLDSPRVDHSLDARMSASCRGIFNQDNEFGNTWSNFRHVGYFGYSNVGVSQSIAVYPDRGSAQTVFDALKGSLESCAADFPVETYGDPYVFTVVDGRTLMAQYPGSVNGQGSVHLYRLDSQIVIEVGTHHYGTEPDGAQKVLGAITSKIRSAA